jgi:hypothetical protein
MGFVANVVSGLRALMRGTRVEQEMDEELGSFLEASRAEKRRAGMTPEQAAHLIEALLLSASGGLFGLALAFLSPVADGEYACFRGH